jgi:hypothetical protein
VLLFVSQKSGLLLSFFNLVLVFLKVMKKYISFVFLLMICAVIYSFNLPDRIDLIDPVPGAKYVNENTNIIIRFSLQLDAESFMKWGSAFTSDSKKNENTLTKKYSSDKNTVILVPHSPYPQNELVELTIILSDKKNYVGRDEKFTSSFRVRKTILKSNKSSIESEIPPEFLSKFHGNLNPKFGADELPHITVNYSTEPTAGYLFLTNFIPFGGVNNPYLLILKNSGDFVYSKKMPSFCYDFKLQPNGNLTYYDYSVLKFYEMDTAYNVIDSFYTGNGYLTDVHELRLLNNGHALLMSYDPELVDLGGGTDGVNSSVTAIGLILQEIDENKNVIFQWRSWDHFLVTDATHENLTGGADIDYVHGNAIELDSDGNWLFSSRNMDEITKINRSNGNIMWRLGGKHNMFTFINDADGFSHQHAIRRIANGNITLFDNGNYHTPPYSRAIEYSLDEINKKATLVWQYRNIPEIFSPAMGYTQRLNNGNTLIGWGFANPTITEVTPDGTRVYEMTLAQHEYTYRAFKFDWKDSSPREVIPTAFGLEQNFPNPFNPVTNIKFQIPVQSRVSINVYDINGKLVVGLINSDLGPGQYSVNWQPQSIASGVYFYKIVAGDFIASKKMILVK